VVMQALTEKEKKKKKRRKKSLSPDSGLRKETAHCFSHHSMQILFCFLFSAVGPYSDVRPWNTYTGVCSQAFRCSAAQDAVILCPAVTEMPFFLYAYAFPWSDIGDGCRGEGICKEDLRICMYDSLEVMFTFKKTLGSWLWWSMIQTYQGKSHHLK